MTQVQLFVLAIALQLVSAYLAYQYLINRTQEKCSVGRFFRPRFLWLELLVCASAFVISVWIFAFGYMRGDDTFMRTFMNAEIFIWLVLIGYIDLRERIIPNAMIGVGLLFALVLILIDIFVAKTPWLKVLTFSGVGGLCIGGSMFLIALLVKSALGMGDVKMFLVLGLLYGLNDTYSIILFSVIIMALISLVLLLLKKVTTKTAIPMAPFAAAGFLLCILAGM